MRRPGGYAVWVDPSSPRPKERDTFTCAHDNRVVFVDPKGDCGGFCRMCMKPICSSCAGKGKCVPFERKLDKIERTNRLRRAAGLD